MYYETSLINLFGARGVKYLKWLYFFPAVIFADVADVDRVWVFANISVGVCALPNLVAVLALAGAFMKLMKDYLSGANQYATKIIDVSKQYVKQARVD